MQTAKQDVSLKCKCDEGIETGHEVELLCQKKEIEEELASIQAQCEQATKKHKTDSNKVFGEGPKELLCIKEPSDTAVVHLEGLAHTQDDPNLISLEKGLEWLMDTVPNAQMHLQSLGPNTVKVLNKLIVTSKIVRQGLEGVKEARPYLRTVASIMPLADLVKEGLKLFLQWRDFTLRVVKVAQMEKNLAVQSAPHSETKKKEAKDEDEDKDKMEDDKEKGTEKEKGKKKGKEKQTKKHMQ
ncbi:uncharacterized protein ACA1_303730 [Acanthamoeba castellanii str. Neff]|uniref:Uncharacterized protein n=1 Tax=Acanthamoeba castellanii (strain ATCC 30010 / Neff) TaxID=1257118 RepID=L8GNG6_ACACF|nr:uncharacterized protein ACA1_303730 [Acanthamoeba castellanii str. Neff]ELR14374.1 hypothetical protein ACA1_303730 [Acanthamoeba castellanii str. Neff]